MENTVVQFGAGNIGRSLVGFIFSELGFNIIFIDKNRELVDLLNRAGEYRIEYREEENGSYHVKNVSAIYTDDFEKVAEAVASAVVVSTAVGVNNLPDIAPLIYSGIKMRKDVLNILICENLKNSADFLRSELDKSGKIDYGIVGLIETSIAKMVPDVPTDVREKNPLVSWAERYSTVYINRAEIRGEFVKSPYLIPVDNFEAYYLRKLYISNMSHTLSSVIGYLNGYRYIADSLFNKSIFHFVERAVHESESALKRKYPFLFETDEGKNYSKDFLKRLMNRMLMDTVYRGGRDIQRKLSSNERLVGPATLYYNLFNRIPENLVRGIAAAFYFDAPGPDGSPFENDIKLKTRIKEDGIESVMSDITRITPDSKLGSAILKEYSRGRSNFLFD